MAAIKDEFANRLSVMKMNLHKATPQYHLCNHTSQLIKCLLMPFCHCFGIHPIVSAPFTLSQP